MRTTPRSTRLTRSSIAGTAVAGAAVALVAGAGPSVARPDLGVPSTSGASSVAEPGAVAAGRAQWGLVRMTPVSMQVMGVHVDGGWLLR